MFLFSLLIYWLIYAFLAFPYQSCLNFIFLFIFLKIYTSIKTFFSLIFCFLRIYTWLYYFFAPISFRFWGSYLLISLIGKLKSLSSVFIYLVDMCEIITVDQICPFISVVLSNTVLYILNVLSPFNFMVINFCVIISLYRCSLPVCLLML